MRALVTRCRPASGSVQVTPSVLPYQNPELQASRQQPVQRCSRTRAAVFRITQLLMSTNTLAIWLRWSRLHPGRLAAGGAAPSATRLVARYGRLHGPPHASATSRPEHHRITIGSISAYIVNTPQEQCNYNAAKAMCTSSPSPWPQNGPPAASG